MHRHPNTIMTENDISDIFRQNNGIVTEKTLRDLRCMPDLKENEVHAGFDATLDVEMNTLNKVKDKEFEDSLNNIGGWLSGSVIKEISIINRNEHLNKKELKQKIKKIFDYQGDFLDKLIDKILEKYFLEEDGIIVLKED